MKGRNITYHVFSVPGIYSGVFRGAFLKRKDAIAKAKKYPRAIVNKHMAVYTSETVYKWERKKRR